MTQADNNTDVVVIGGGFAGIVAANRLLELGRRPIVLEQGADASYLCNSRYTGGALHVGFRDPVGRGPDELLDLILTRSPVASVELADALAHDARRVITWLQEHGIRLARSGAAEYKAWTLAPFRDSGDGLEWQGLGSDIALSALTDTLLARGGLLSLNTRAIELDHKNASHLIVSARVGDKTQRFRAQAVIIADGGFQANAELIREFIMTKPEKLVEKEVQRRAGATDYVWRSLRAPAALA